MILKKWCKTGAIPPFYVQCSVSIPDSNTEDTEHSTVTVLYYKIKDCIIYTTILLYNHHTTTRISSSWQSLRVTSIPMVTLTELRTSSADMRLSQRVELTKWLLMLKPLPNIQTKSFEEIVHRFQQNKNYCSLQTGFNYIRFLHLRLFRWQLHGRRLA